MLAPGVVRRVAQLTHPRTCKEKVALQMLFPAMLVHAAHPALEDAKEPFGSIRPWTH